MNLFINERINLSGQEWIPGEQNLILANIENLYNVLKCMPFHNDVKIFYSSSGWSALISNLNELEVYTDTLLTDRLRLILLSINSIDWESTKKQKSDVCYFHQINAGATPNLINDTTIAEACEYKYENRTVALINLISSDYNETNPLYINRSIIKPPVSMQILSLDIIVSKTETIAFLESKRIKRIYKHNPKHGENGKGTIANKGEKVSALECSITEASDLLKHAVSSSKKNELYIFDIKRKKYIVYKAESKNTYHAYHPNNQNEIPNDVKSFLEQ